MEHIYLKGLKTFVASDDVTGQARLTVSHTHKVLLRHTYQEVKDGLAGKSPDFLERLGEVLAQEVARESGLEQVVFEGALLGGVIFDCDALRKLEKHLDGRTPRILLDKQKRGAFAFYWGEYVGVSVEVAGFDADSMRIHSVSEYPEVWEELRPLALAALMVWLLAMELEEDRVILGEKQYSAALSTLAALHQRARGEVQRILGEAFNAERTVERWADLCGLPTVDSILDKDW